MALPHMTLAEAHPDVRWSTSPRTCTHPLFWRSVTTIDASSLNPGFQASQTACAPVAAALLPAVGYSDPLQNSFADATGPNCAAPQHAHCQDQQYHDSLQWSDTVLPGPSLHSCCHSIAADHPSLIGPATAAAACTAALAEILDSLGGPNISEGWGRLALACGSPNAAVSRAPCPSATSHQPRAEELQYISQHAKEASGNMLPDHCTTSRSTCTATLDYATHAAQLADLDSISHLTFGQPPSYTLPPPLPIWSLDILPSAEAQLIDWCDATVLPYLQGTPVLTATSSDWHHDTQKPPLPLPLPLLPNLPHLNPQLAAQPAAGTAAAAAVTVDTNAAKPKKRKGI